MTNCPRCGSQVQPHHKFCGTCAAPLAAPPAAAPMPGAPPAPPAPPQGFGAPPGPEYPPVAQPYGAPAQPHGAPPAGFAPSAAPPHQPVQGAANAGAPSRCQFGHDIAPGFTYCQQGHPISLDAMQFAGGEAFGQGQPPAPSPGFAHAPAAPPAPSPSPPFAAPAPQPELAPPGYPPTGAMSPFPNAPAAAPPPGAAPQPPSPESAPTSPGPAPDGRRQLAGFLVSFHNDPLGNFFPLYAGQNLVGRAGATDGLNVELPDPATSTNHATIHVEPSTGRVVLEDTGSTNGTFVNEQYLAPQSRGDLRDGDAIRFGSYVARLMTVKRG